MVQNTHESPWKELEANIDTPMTEKELADLERVFAARERRYGPSYSGFMVRKLARQYRQLREQQRGAA